MRPRIPRCMRRRSKTHERDALEDYLKLGYVPEHGEEGGYGTVSMTQEYDSADFALSQFAAALGDRLTARCCCSMRRTGRISTIRRPATSKCSGVTANGRRASQITLELMTVDATVYVEGTAGQYLWMEPFNYKGLADIMGGQDAASKRLGCVLHQTECGRSRSRFDGWHGWATSRASKRHGFMISGARRTRPRLSCAARWTNFIR